MKKCKCGADYHQYTTLQNKCPKCLADHERKKREKKEGESRKEFRRETKKMKDSAKTRPQLAADAQKAFNRFIRVRDAASGCVCCNNRHYDGQYHAGHYLSVGAHPELRFEEDNCHKQKSSCNSYKSGNQVQYRKYLIAKIGIDRVEWLEGPHEARNYTHDELREIKVTYNRKTRELLK